jgi:diguanylate cyclase (GGDEF)-like protein
MKNKPEGVNLRQSVSGRGRTLAVFSLAKGNAFETDAGIDLIRGVWDGEPAVAVVASPEILPQLGSHENDFKSLHEISFELSLCQNVEDVCREAVRLGHERLGFDRLGIWLIDLKDSHWKKGTWGIDENGKLRDERRSRIRRSKGVIPASFCDGRIPLFCDEDGPCLDHEGREVGHGNRLIAPLWDGHTVIGDLDVDDFFGHKGFSPEKREVLVLFTRVVAHLLSLKRAEAELQQLASTDPLTGMVNRRTALIILEKHLGQYRRSGAPLTLCLADLDGLKIVNDAYGHAAGDEYIRDASVALVGAVRGSDTVGRIGGDEFLVVFPDCRGDVVAEIMERVNAEMAAGAKGKGYVPRLSWGMASPSELALGGRNDNADLQRCIDMLLELADQRMYDNKRTKGAPRLPASGEAELAF